MSGMKLKLICNKSKQGHSLTQISELTGLTQDQVMETLAQATGLTPEELSIIFHMKQRGLSLAQIYQDTDVALQILEQFLTDSQEAPAVIRESVVGFEPQIEALFSQGLRPPEIGRRLGISERAVLACTLGSPDEGVSLTSKASEPAPVYHRTPEEAKQPQRPTQTQPQHSPTFFYSCQDNQLHRVNLLTGEQSKHEVPHYQFKACCHWSELPGGSLLITGGGACQAEVRDVVRVDVGTFAVSPQPPMHTARSAHAAVYHSQYVYVLGGFNYPRSLSECERYVCAESRWEVLAALPVGGMGMSALELHNSLYALGGVGDRELDTVQKLSLDSLTWQLMQLKLPQTAWIFPCFNKDTEVCLVINKTLYSFTPLDVKPIKTLPEDIECYSSYYSRGTLYYDNLGFGIGLTRL
jgi:hypothetical protein